MNIRGFHKTSFIDYPGKISAVIFTAGCNLRCGFCHNSRLVLNGDDLPLYENDEILSYLKKRAKLLDGVVVTGGEPTLNSGLVSFIEAIKTTGLSVKLDTNGLRPDMIGSLISKGLLDYAAVDIKTSPEKYEMATGSKVDFSKILETINILNSTGIDHEARTTCIPGIVNDEDIVNIGRAAGHIGRYFLQQFISGVPMIDESLENILPYPADTLYRFRELASAFADVCEIRGL